MSKKNIILSPESKFKSIDASQVRSLVGLKRSKLKISPKVQFIMSDNILSPNTKQILIK